MNRRFFLLSIFLIITMITSGQIAEKKQYRATRISEAPVINGQLDDLAWSNGDWESGFVQFMPNEGTVPSMDTEFKILFDDSNIYVAIKAYDSSPDSIVSRMTRRDNIDGDMLGVSFDSYHDLRTAFTFLVSSAGVKNDLIETEDGTVQDESWDPIWYVQTEINDAGWHAEMKIPLTQLRFEKESSGLWGMNVVREIFRYNEVSFWQAIPRTSSGSIHEYGEMVGLRDIKPKRQLDITPYVVTSLRTSEKEDGNPFATGRDYNYSGGLDAKIGLTNNMTLDLSINPDFGQVEADPSVVNLTAFETFYSEKRPFFIEGRNITSFSLGVGGGDIGNDNLFYSRRIGSAPKGYPTLFPGDSLHEREYANIPSNTRILGAAKITGKTENGLSIGILESLTQRVFAEIDSEGDRREEEIEPLTNYLVGRIQKDINNGNTIIGGMLTNTSRSIGSTNLALLHKSAITSGIDFLQYFDNKNWYVSTNIGVSYVSGSAESISRTQLSSRHYFQRPDATHVDFDPDRTTLAGHGGNIQIGKMGGNFNFNLVNMWKSPGFEVNDLGYVQGSDEMNTLLWIGYRFTKPFSIFRYLFFSNTNWIKNDFGFNYQGLGVSLNANAQFKNNWSGALRAYFTSQQRVNTFLRGGPSILIPGSQVLGITLSTDSRKKVTASLATNQTWRSENFTISNSSNLVLSYQPMDNLKISLNTRYYTNDTELQYVRETAYEDNSRYIFGTISQKLLSMSIRINFNITPDFSVEYWGQPYLTSADYSDFKMITNPNADALSERYSLFTADQIRLENPTPVYYIDEDRDSSDDYAFGNPNFNYNDFLSNFVARYEIVPGTILYFVWSQTRNYTDGDGRFNISENVSDLFVNKKANNTILIKFSYRFGFN